MSQQTFTTEDYADFRLNLAIKKVGQELLANILEGALEKEKKQLYSDFLFVGKKVTPKAFDSSQKEKLKNDCPSAFDITLIFKIFLYGCSELAPSSDPRWRSTDEFEYWLKKTKDLRNDITHSSHPIPYTDLNNWMKSIKDTLLQLIKTYAERFQISEDRAKELERKVKRKLDAILTSPLTQMEIDEYLLTEGIIEAQERYKKLSIVNPVDFFVGLEFSMQVDDVFVSLEIKELTGHEGGQTVDLKNLLKPFEEKRTALIAIEGLAGSGKTTLIKYILSRWIDCDEEIEGLNRFEYLIFLQCNNAYINSLYDLISSIMPETARRFDPQKLIDSILCRNLLVVVDGVDETHTGTRAVLKELLNKATGRKIKFLCTSRPEKIQWLYRIKGNLKCATFSITGIPNVKRKEFVKKLHKYYTAVLKEERVISVGRVISMLQNFPISIKTEMRLPIFLALFTYFCTVEPDRVSQLDSVFSLYNELTNALKEKLYTRSMSRNDSKDDDEVKWEIDQCIKTVCDLSFVSLSQDEYTVSWDSFQDIKSKCMSLGLTPKEILSAFLVVKVILTPRGVEEAVGYPHKGLQEFLAAKAIVERIKCGQSLYDILKIKESSQMSLPIGGIRDLDLNTDFMKNQNLLTHIASFASEEKLTSDKTINEIVSLYKRAGIYEFERWLCLFATLKDHALISEYILMKFKKMSIHEGNMDSFVDLLKFGCPSEVILSLNLATKTLHKLKSVLDKLISRDCNLKLLLNHHFAMPHKYSAHNLMSYFTRKDSSCNLTWFTGCLSENDLQNLPQSVQVLRLGIGTSSHACALRLLETNLTNVFMLRLHIERQIKEKDIPRLKLQMNDLILYLSGMENSRDDLVWAEKVALKISHTKRYGKIIFPKSNMKKYTMVHLFKSFSKAGITAVQGIKVSSSVEDLNEEELAKSCLYSIGCRFNLVKESEIWPN